MDEVGSYSSIYYGGSSSGRIGEIVDSLDFGDFFGVLGNLESQIIQKNDINENQVKLTLSGKIISREAWYPTTGSEYTVLTYIFPSIFNPIKLRALCPHLLLTAATDTTRTQKASRASFILTQFLKFTLID